MIIEKDSTFNLEELSQEVKRQVAAHGLVGSQPDRRVSGDVDIRTIRYYSTLGLVNRPTMEGREARYGRRHVLQLVAIKALQSTSLNLSEIQARLYGRNERELESIINAVSARVATREEMRSVAWNEWIIEPGLKIVVEEDWSPVLDDREREQRIRAVLEASRKKGKSVPRRKKYEN